MAAAGEEVVAALSADVGLGQRLSAPGVRGGRARCFPAQAVAGPALGRTSATRSPVTLPKRLTRTSIFFSRYETEVMAVLAPLVCCENVVRCSAAPLTILHMHAHHLGI